MNKRHTDSRRSKRSGSSDLIGIAVIAVSAFFLLCIIIPIVLGAFGYFIRGVVLGVFGLFAYPLFLSTLLLGIALVRDLSLKISLKYKVCIGIIAFCVMMILQLATSFGFLGEGFSYYISSVYTKLTAGGVFFGVLAYGLQAAVTQVFAYILLSTGVIICVLIMLDVFHRLGGKKERKEPVEEEPKRLSFEKSDTPARMVKPIENNGLFVGNIVRTQNAHPVRTTGGDFTDMRSPEPEKTYTRDVSKNNAARNSDTMFGGYDAVSEKYGVKTYDNENKNAKSGFNGYNVEEDNLTDRERAHKRLFGNREARSRNYFNDIIPTVNNGFSSPSNSSESSGNEYKTGVITPSTVLTPPEIKNNRPPKIMHTETKTSFYEVVIPEAKDVSGSYVDGEITDGEAVSKKLAEDRKEEAKFDFDKGKGVKPTTFTPIERVSVSDKNEETSQPIINGDYYGENADSASAERSVDKEPQKEADKPVRGYDDIPTLAMIEEPKLDNVSYYDKEPLAPIEDGSSFGMPKIEKSERQPLRPTENDFEKTIKEADTSDKTDGFAKKSGFNYADEVEDLSETSRATGEDNTGYYTTDDVLPIVEPPAPPVTERNKARFNQMGFTDIVMEREEVPKPKPKKKHTKYVPPPFELLECDTTDPAIFSGDVSEKAKTLEETLESLKLPAKVTGITIGPAVTRYELEVPPGTSVRKIDGFSSDIEYNLASNGKIRIETPIPGKRAVGIEVPNTDIATVGLRDLLESKEFQTASSPVTLAIGKDIAGNNIICNLEKMPHLLIAGATNSGKSACLNSIITSILYKASPDEVRMILIDPKEVEFRIYQDMPHLLIKDIISETDQAIRAFKWAKNEMDRRYKLLSHYYARNILEFNSNACVKDGIEEKMPRIVIIVDELCELMMSANRKDLEDKIMSMAQKARAAGIHLILATQRPSVDVITGTIKANLPSRIAFSVSSFNDSRTILDQGGAESLLGKGDMLYSPADMAQPKRVQGAFIKSKEVEDVVNYVKEHNQSDYDSSVEDLIMTEETPATDSTGGDDDEEFDPLIKDVLRRVIETGQASTSMIQRRFSVGYARASRIIDQMEMHRFIGPLEGSNKPREVYITAEQFRETFGEDI